MIYDDYYDLSFDGEYRKFILSRCQKDKIPNPTSVAHGSLLNWRPWEWYQVWKHADFKQSDVVLDTGALHTYVDIWLKQFVSQLIVTDNFYWAERSYNRDLVLQSPKEWMDYLLSKEPGLLCEQADLQHLPYPDNTFDKLISVSTIEHVVADTTAIKEMIRVIKPGGSVLITCEFHPTNAKPYSETDGSYYRIYDEQGLRDLVSPYKHSDFIVQPLVRQGQANTNAFFSLTKDRREQ